MGHHKLIQKVIEVAKTSKADHYIFLSQTNKAPKDPLSWDYKVRVAKQMFPGVNIVTDASIRTPFAALEYLGKSYKNVIMVVGDDRVAEFQNSMSKYTEQWGIENFKVISAGERDPDADGVAGMSASKVRQLAADGNFDAFAQGLPDTISDTVKKQVYDKVRQGMGIE